VQRIIQFVTDPDIPFTQILTNLKEILKSEMYYILSFKAVYEFHIDLEKSSNKNKKCNVLCLKGVYFLCKFGKSS